MKKQSIFWSLLLIGISQTLSFGQRQNPPLSDGPPCPPYCGFKTYTFTTKGKQILDPCGSPIVLKGVNKMAVFDHADPFGKNYFREIARTKANCVRIAWEMTSQVNNQTIVNPLSRLDSLITNAKKNKLIPIVGLWDYTTTGDGGFSKLNEYVTYWTQPSMKTLINKHKTALILNIANEAAKSAEHGGNEDVPADLDTFATAYKKAIVKLRRNGINVPIMIDGMDRGKSLHCFAVKGAYIANADTLTNVIFSFHAYWPKSATDADPGYIQAKFNKVSSLNTPIVIGELSKYGAWPGDSTISVCSAAGIVDYKQFAQRADAAGIGWLIWEWGPGNQWKVAGDCPQMDMTTNGTIATLGNTPANAWAKELTTDNRIPYSIEKTAQKTFFIDSGLKSCPNNN